MPRPERAIDRRGFLAALGTLVSGSWLSGCMLAPGDRLWGTTTWAERLDKWLLERALPGRRMAREYPRSAISTLFPIRSLTLPDYYPARLETWELVVDGLIARPERFSLAEFRRALPYVALTTRHDCVEGWSAIAEFGGARLADLIQRVGPLPEARYVVFYSADGDEMNGPFYGSLDLHEALHPQTLLAYEMNGLPLSIDHGAPLRLRIPTQLGYKSTKYIHRIRFVETLAGIGAGQGGYWEDQGYEHYAGV